MESVCYDAPFCQQTDGHSCLPCCAKAVLQCFGCGRIPLRSVKVALGTDREGTCLGDAAQFLRYHGLKCLHREQLIMPESVARRHLRMGKLIIASTIHEEQPHVVVLYGFTERGRVRVMDPLGYERFYGSCTRDRGYLVIG